jgi:hypothetical protein
MQWNTFCEVENKVIELAQRHLSIVFIIWSLPRGLSSTTRKASWNWFDATHSWRRYTWQKIIGSSVNLDWFDRDFNTVPCWTMIVTEWTADRELSDTWTSQNFISISEKFSLVYFALVSDFMCESNIERFTGRVSSEDEFRLVETRHIRARSIKLIWSIAHLLMNFKKSN